MGDLQTAVLLGFAGKIFENVREILEKQRIQAIGIEEDVLRDDEKCAQTADSLFKIHNNIRYILYSTFIDKRKFPDTIPQMSGQEWETWKQTGYKKLFNVSRTFVKQMAEHGGGHFLAVGSVTGLIPANGEELNGAVSAAAFMVVKSMALELAGKGITANAVALGLLEEAAGVVTLKDSDAVRSHIPAKQAISTEDAARGITQILTCGLPQFNGNVITLDAGFSCNFMRDW